MFLLTKRSCIDKIYFMTVLKEKKYENSVSPKLLEVHRFLITLMLRKGLTLSEIARRLRLPVHVLNTLI